MKQLTVAFITDRRKYSENDVKIVVPPKPIISKDEADKAIKVVQVLNALGSCCWIGEAELEPEEVPNSTEIIIATFLTGLRVQKIINKFIES